MWDGLLHRNSFRHKCKTAIARTKTRLEVIQKKRNAMQKFLKKDIADLLKNNLDRNAYGRAEGLYNELNLSSSYDYVEHCCACISENLKQMQKERECPEECKVAVSSLVYAAARFADLPELRELRNQFNDKYGKSLEPFVSKETSYVYPLYGSTPGHLTLRPSHYESVLLAKLQHLHITLDQFQQLPYLLVEKLKSKPPTMEMKLQLMQEIAQEFSMTWDSLPVQQQLHSQGTNNTNNDKMSRSRSSIGKVKAMQEDGTEKVIRTRRHNSYSGSNENISEIFQENNNVADKKIKTCIKNDAANNPSRKPFTNKIIPAPYTVSDERENTDIASKNKEDSNPHFRSEPERIKGKNDDEQFGKAKPRPRSVRTKFLKPSASSATRSSEHDIDVKEIRSARVSQERKYDIFSDDDDEEEILGKFRNIKRPLRTPVSERNTSFPTSPESGDIETPRSALLPPTPGKRRYLFTNSLPVSPPETPSSSGRSKYPPPDNQEPESPIEPKISPMRNVKSESLISSGGTKHVHPKMPSFDELADRVAALQKD